MKILVKRFSLCHDGVNYGAGSVADIPDDVATELIQQAPKEFAVVDVPVADETPAMPTAPVTSADNGGLPPVDAEKLRKK